MPGDGRSVVHLHVGLFKTGTTYLQQVLWHNRGRLGADGVLVPGRSKSDQGRAVRDVLEIKKWGEEDPRTSGAWDSLVEQIRAWPGASTVLSMEILGIATPEQVEGVVTELAPAEVHVVVTARDLARAVPASWQMFTRNGYSWSWSEFLDAIGRPDPTDHPAAQRFWRQQDLLGVLRTWEAAVPRERCRVVTVPPRGAPRNTLWERFATAVDLDPTRYESEVSIANESIGAASAELLRRVNPGLVEAVPWPVYQSAVTIHLGKRVLVKRAELPIGFDPRSADWLAERAQAVVSAVEAGGYSVIGDLQELIPRADDPVRGKAPDQLSDTEVLDAALDAVRGLVEKVGETQAELQSAREQLSQLRRLRSTARRARGRLRGAYRRLRAARNKS